MDYSQIERKKVKLMYKLYEKIAIVSNDNNKGYVVDINNKAMMKNAKKWAGDDYKISEINNEGFEVELYEGAHWSSQGGRVSFMNCKVRKDGEEWIIGISSDLLLSTLKNSTCINGIFKEKMRFARNSGDIGIMHEGMESYKSALQDMEYRKLYEVSKKTKKRMLGYRYFNLTEDKVFIGVIYSYLNKNISNFSDIINSKKIKYKNIADKYDVYIKTQNIPAHIHKLSDLLLYLSQELEKGNFLLEYQKCLMSSEGNKVKYGQKSLSRAQGDRIIECDVDEDKFDSYLEELRKAQTDYLMTEYPIPISLKKYIRIDEGLIFAVATLNLPYDFTIEQKRFFEYTNSELELELIELN